MGATERLAQFTCNLEFNQIPVEALMWAKDAILDCIGVALAGTQEEVGKIITNYVSESGGRPDAGVFAAGFKTNASNAALANGTIAHALDYDDYTLPNWTGHPSAPILPAIFALGQREGISGRDVLMSYIIGFEVGGRLGAGLGRTHHEHGWHPTTVLGTMGASAACSRILKLNVTQTRMALGIASSQACGIRQNLGTMTKPLHAGLAARNGVTSALLAHKNMTADPKVIEGPVGFGKVFSDEKEFNESLVVDTIMTKFLIVESGVSIKPYPCCAEGHRCLDAMLYLAKKHKINAEDVKSIECCTSDIVPKVMLRHRPKNAEEAKFSLEYCMAVALLDRKAGLEQFTTRRVSESQVQELLRRVNYVHPPKTRDYINMKRLPEKVTIQLFDGTVFSHEVLNNKGKPENRLSRQELVEKFVACAKRAIPIKHVNRALEMLQDIEKLEDIGGLMKILCK